MLFASDSSSHYLCISSFFENGDCNHKGYRQAFCSIKYEMIQEHRRVPKSEEISDSRDDPDIKKNKNKIPNNNMKKEDIHR
jgi:hypothetical protein